MYAIIKDGIVTSVLNPNDPRYQIIVDSPAINHYTQIDIPQEIAEDIFQGESYKITQTGFEKVIPEPLKPKRYILQELKDKANSTPKTPEQKRKQAYATHKLIKHEEEMVTVDRANYLYIAYIAEEDTQKAKQLKISIIEAKQHIRALYPDQI